MANTNLKLHPIHRDSNEKYLVVVGRGDIEVLDTSGTAATLTISADAANYLKIGNPTADDLRLVSIRDFTIILNTLATIDTEDLIISFSVTETFDTYTKMTSRIATPDAYYRATGADAGGEPSGFYQYVVAAADNGFANWTSNAMAIARQRPGGKWNNSGQNPMGFRARFKRQALAITNLEFDEADNDEGAKALISAGSFSGYTFVAGDEIHITATGGTSLPEGWYAIASAGATPADSVLLTGAYRDTNDDAQTWSGGNKTDSDSDYTSVSGGSGALNITGANTASDMDDVAEKLQAKMRLSSGLEEVIIGWREADKTFIVVSPFRGTAATIVNFYAPDSGTDLTTTSGVNSPFKFTRGTANAGTGTPTTDTEPVDDRWAQVPAPGENDTSIDATTMPVKLTRDTISPLAFSVSVIDWKPRLSGTHDTNPAPSVFVDSDGNDANVKLVDIGFFSNRLILLGDENVVFSQDGDVFNFFLDDFDTLVDSDPIDKSLSSTQVTLGDYVVPYRDTVIITTKAGVQFEMNAPETFKQATVAITPSTSYALTPNVRPQPLNNSLFFTGPAGNRSALYEYRFEEGSVASIAEEVSAHSPHLLPLDIKNLQTAGNFGTVFILPRDCNAIYVYQQFKIQDQRQQAAWSKWVFDSSYNIDDIAVIEDELYMMVRDGNNLGRRLLEKINIAKSIVALDSDCSTDTDPTC